KKPALRSSSRTVTSIAGWRQRATASGVEREPGESTARRTPQRASSSTRAEASAVLRLVGSIGETLEGASPQQRFIDLNSEPGALGEGEPVALEGGAGADRLGEEALGGEAVGGAARRQRLRCVGGGGDADRPLQRAGEIDRDLLGH